ncbi:MAG: pyridoxal 5'-phosphate synthase glutaminase subunit PdxT [Chloroflexi bacterium]|nr:MAG: pyridoxal 5'-phosphate synthase glutaminase subunit PdxT [Chloroflexota bacterium]
MNGSQSAAGKRRRVGVLGLQGDFQEHLEVLREIDVEPVDVRRPEHLEGVDALIIPGGESTTISKLSDLYGLTEPIRERARHGMPLWGTCAGAIFLATRVPGRPQTILSLMDMTVERNAFGRQVDSFEADLKVPKLGPAPFHAVFIRAPKITEVGKGVNVLSRLDDGTIVAAQQGTLLATSFHPELTPDRRFHRYLVDLIDRS